MIPIRFQGCHMGIFGLMSWDSPPPLPPHLASGLAPRVLSEQATVPASSKGVHQSNATSSSYSPGAHAAVMEKNPFWPDSGSTQVLPVEKPSPPLGVEKMHEARFRRSEVIGSQNHTVEDHVTSRLNPASPEFVPKVDPLVANQVGCRLIAKHNYEANPNSPLGAHGELNLRRMEQLIKIGCHPEHSIWWLARNENGKEGYVPASYVMVLEEKCGLPWLQNRASEEEEEAPSTALSAKPYRSAYNRNSTTLTGSTQFTCEPCGKSFNGPQPYRAHMSSRAHRETLETMD